MMRHRSAVSILAWFGIGAAVVGLAYGQRGGSSSNPIPSGQVATVVVVTSSPDGAACSDNNVYIYSTNGASYCCINGTRQACGATAALGLPSDPSACASSRFVTDTNTSGTLTCTQPAFSDLSGSATDAQIPNTITVSRTDARAISIDGPVTGEDITIFNAPVALTIIKVEGVLTSSGTVPFTIRYSSDRSASGTQVNSGGTSCTSTTTGCEVTGLTAAVSAGDWVWIETGTVSGSPLSFNATITYTVP